MMRSMGHGGGTAADEVDEASEEGKGVTESSSWEGSRRRSQSTPPSSCARRGAWWSA